MKDVLEAVNLMTEIVNKTTEGANKIMTVTENAKESSGNSSENDDTTRKIKHIKQKGISNKDGSWETIGPVKKNSGKKDTTIDHKWK